MAPDELLRGLPGYPYTAWLLVALVVAAGVLKSWQNRPQKQRDTNERFGGRLEVVERELRLEQLRRVQVEHELIRSGIALPLWPTDPEQPAPRPFLEDDDDAPATALRASHAALPQVPRRHGAPA